MAVGRLGKIWLEVPEDLDDMETLKEAFGQFFGEKWEDIMVGASRPFVYHKDWHGYFAVTGLETSPGELTVPEVTGEKYRAYNVIVGT